MLTAVSGNRLVTEPKPAPNSIIGIAMGSRMALCMRWARKRDDSQIAPMERDRSARREITNEVFSRTCARVAMHRAAKSFTLDHRLLLLPRPSPGLISPD